MDINNILSKIPKVDDILNDADIAVLMSSVPRQLIVDTVREVLNETRMNIRKNINNYGENNYIELNTIVDKVKQRVSQKNKNHLKRVINCTGVIIHTNLGRSLLCKDAYDAAYDAARYYSNLEYNLEAGERGSRHEHVEYLITKITGAESAAVVNNNAAAVLIVLAALCRNKEAVVSRGELVEIGGSFRIPEVMEQSGAILKEVGATNRTHLYDYENAINDNTGILLKVHTSNYRILGFAESVSGRELASLGDKYSIPVVEDLGSGSFINLKDYGISYEPTVLEAVKAGIDIVTFSGDKMLGGPQAGIIVGRKKYIDMVKRHPLARAVRVDKMTLAALEATLKQYLDIDMAIRKIPTLRMITEPKTSLLSRAEKLMEILKSTIGNAADIHIVDENSQVGGGSMPLENLPTYAVCIKPKAISVNDMEKRMRMADPPVIVRTRQDSLLLDIRTIMEDEYNIIGACLAKKLGEAL